MSPKARLSLALFLLFLTPGEWLSAYPLTQAQRERLTSLVPKTLDKLERRQPVHVAVIGDGVSQMVTLDDNRGNILESLHGHFLKGLEGEFYYTGGVRLVNPIGGHPQKNRDHKGEEITFEQFTDPSATGLSALQQLTTRVFLNRPDLVVIHLGLNDYRFGLLLETYRRSLDQSIRLCRGMGSEVCLVGPTLVRDGPDVRAWGGTRLFAETARDLAQRSGVMFLDPALELARTRPVPAEEDAAERASQLSTAIAMDLFDYGPGIREGIFMNSESHQRAGREMFDQFLNGTPRVDWDISATAVLARPNEMDVEFLVTNASDEPRQAVVAALNVGYAWFPVKSEHAIDIAPGETKRLPVKYQRRERPGSSDDVPLYQSLQTLGSRISCPLLIGDLDSTRLVDVSAPLGPVGVQWKHEPSIGQRGTFPLKFTLTNPGAEMVSGNYELFYANQRARGSFQLNPLQSKEFSAQCGLPKDKNLVRVKDPVRLTVTTNSTKFVFEREIEAIRNQRLGQPVALANADHYRSGERVAAVAKPGVTMKPDAGADAIQFTFDVKEVELQSAEGQPSVMVEIAIDGRPKGECHTFGFVEPLQFGFLDQDGPGQLYGIAPAAFGNGYIKELSPRGIFSRMQKSGAGQRRIEITIPRAYLYRRGWNVGAPGDSLGVLARLSFLRRDPGSGGILYPREAEWSNAGSSLHRTDAAGLAAVELAPGTSDAWSVRLY